MVPCTLSSQAIECLVAKAQKGDEDSFAQIFDYFHPKVHRHVSFRVENQEAADLTAQIFLKVVDHFERYSPRKNAHFSAWLFRIANNTIIDFYRRKKDFLGLDEEEGAFFTQIPDEDRPTPDESANLQLNTEKLHTILADLPALQRTVLELRYLEGLSVAETAHVVEKSEGNVRIIQLRALRAIRERWGEGGE